MTLSRQRRLQLAHRRLGLCEKCSEPRDPRSKIHCTAHLIAGRERSRRQQGCDRRNYGAASYGLKQSAVVWAGRNWSIAFEELTGELVGFYRSRGKRAQWQDDQWPPRQVEITVREVRG